MGCWLFANAQQRYSCTPNMSKAAHTRDYLDYPTTTWDPNRTYRQPVILITFKDCDFSMADPVDFYSRILNEPGYNEGAGPGCLADYFKKYPVLYAGPAKTPEGSPCGSMGPTTANRMDPYVDEFQSLGASLVMIAKCNRSDVVTEACKKYGGFYLGSIGGVAAVLSQSSIKSIECVEYPELGMEAVWKIEVEDFPAFILVDDKGNDFFKTLKPWTPCAK